MTNDKKQSFHVLINSQSGTVLRMGREAIENAITASNIEIETFHMLPPDKFGATLTKFKDSDHPILIGGGDGTIKSAVEILSETKNAFGILPMGTMNLFARDLSIPCEIEDALEAYAKSISTVNVDIGMVNDFPFLCCVGVGTMPESAEFREDNREQNDAILMPRLTLFVLNQMDRLKQRAIKISLDGKQKRIKTAALVISNNQYHPENAVDNNNFVRPSLRDGKLGIYSAAPISIWDRVRLILNLKFGNWRHDPVIKEWCAETVCLKTKSNEELISLDGETQTFSTPLNFWIEKEALPVLVPNECIKTKKGK